MTAAHAIPAAAALPAAERPWIHSPGWDAFWILSALWAAGLLLLGRLLEPVWLLVLAAFAVDRTLSVAHSWSTTWMVLGSPLLADARRGNRLKFSWIPLGLALLGMALGLAVAAWQRYPPDGRFDSSLWIWGLYLALFWVGHFWHFGNQDFGVLTLYRMRAGQTGERDRRVDKLYTAAMMFGIQPVIYVCLVTTAAFSEMVRTAVPFSTATAQTIAVAAMAVAAALTLGAVGFELRKPNRSLPRLLYLLVIFLHPALLTGAILADDHTLGLLYVVAYLWSHWFIAVGLVGRINAGYYASRGDSPWTALLRHAALIGAVAGVALLLTERHQQYALFNAANYKEMLAGIGPGETLVIGLVLGFFLAEQLVHYWCDRCLFRFRDASVRDAVAPLLLGRGAGPRQDLRRS